MKNISRFISILFFAVISALPVFADTIPAGFKGNLVEINDQQIRVYQTGSGPDILLIHGLPGCIEDWETIIPKLSKKYRVTAFDRPGHGFSSANKLKYNLAQNADFAFALIDKFKLNNTVVVGHSYGCSTVVEMAERKTSNVKAFVSVSPVTSSRGKPDIIFYILKTPVIGPASAWIVKLITGCSMIREGLDEAFDPNQKDRPQGFAENRCMIFSQPKVIKTLSHEEMTMRADVNRMKPLYGNIKKPLFIVHGESDKVVPVADGMLLHKEAPGSKLIIYKNTGHMVQYAKPSELIEVIKEAAH